MMASRHQFALDHRAPHRNRRAPADHSRHLDDKMRELLAKLDQIPYPPPGENRIGRGKDGGDLATSVDQPD